jgi:DNA/RNA-binding domain of Phe-tRNA-synthetase-like protein
MAFMHASVSHDKDYFMVSDDNGAWVKAWIWVDFAGTELDKGLYND